MNHYHPTKESVVHAVDSESEYKVPLPQPFQMPRRHLTMWDQQVSHHATRRGSEHQKVLSTLFPYQPMHGNEPLMSTEDITTQDMYIVEPDEEPMQHLVLLPLGKTGAGKSSLLNLMLGYNEFTAKAAAKSVTDRITERTGIWVIDQIETLITVADTPGFADSMNRDQAFLSVFKEFIQDIGSRVGIDAFMLVFQCNSPTNK
ncbi:hypothetical protein CU098_010022 [Rhizopus stolonifer]|uniref:AIG1-type G domain-containing protein n=1 Tax=Rhizopus stolonifer TaxID=4846 RepID=A0A367KSW0_RHIST|nr:hypothetical protein CU098_010022 [Rhizopus stolonifer]